MSFSDRLLLNACSLVAGSLMLSSFGLPPAFATAPQLESTVMNNARFAVLAEFDNQAVRDNDTGLVWERAPRLGVYEWDSARQQCSVSNTGGRTGWRVPTVQELSSLVDRGAADLKLPAGHPFINVEAAIYWSATRHEHNAGYARFVNFSSGGSSALEQYMSSFVWCVRSE